MDIETFFELLRTSNEGEFKYKHDHEILQIDRKIRETGEYYSFCCTPDFIDSPDFKIEVHRHLKTK